MAKSERVAVARWLSASCWCLSLHPDYVSFLRMVLVRDHAHLRQAALPHLQAFQSLSCPQPLGLEPRVFPGTHFVLSTLPLMRRSHRVDGWAGWSRQLQTETAHCCTSDRFRGGSSDHSCSRVGCSTNGFATARESGPAAALWTAAALPPVCCAHPPPPGEHGCVRIPTASGGTPCSPSLISDQMATSAKPQRCIPIKNRIVRSVKVQHRNTRVQPGPTPWLARRDGLRRIRLAGLVRWRWTADR